MKTKLKRLLSAVMIMASGLGTAFSEPQPYILFGRSMVDAEGNNVYSLGGNPVKYYVTVDLASPQASFTGLLPVKGQTQTIKVPYASGDTMMTLKTPHAAGDYGVVVGTDEWDYPVGIVGATPYGIGYLNYHDEVVMDISASGEKIKPRTGMVSVPLGEDGTYGSYFSCFDCIYDAVLLLQSEQPSVAADVEDIDFGIYYPWGTATRRVCVFNPTQSEVALSVTAQGRAFSSSQTRLTLAPESCEEIDILLSADTAGVLEGKCVLTYEGGILEIPLKADIREIPDYSAIVSPNEGLKPVVKGNFPWEMTSSDGKIVAMSTNKGQENTQSVLAYQYDIPSTHFAKLGWQGEYYPYYPTTNPFIVALDGEEKAYVDSDGLHQLSGELTLPGGKHTVEFIYEKGYSPTLGQDYEYGKDYVQISSVRFTHAEATAHAGHLSVENVDFGTYFSGSILYPTAEKTIELINDGTAPLNVQSTKTDGAFRLNLPDGATNATVPVLGSITLTATFNVGKTGEFTGKPTLVTDCGELSLNCSANVVDMPPFQSIVKEGNFIFDTDHNYPFTVKDGVAYNETSGVTDDEETTSFLVAAFEVPEGKVGRLSWKGMIDTQPNDGSYYSDVAAIVIDDYMKSYRGKCEALPNSFDPYAIFLNEGIHNILFIYYQNGDGMAYGQDRIGISELSLTLIDSADESVEIWNDASLGEMECYDLSMTRANATIANTGFCQVTIPNLTNSEHFSVECDTSRAYEQYELIPVTVTFNPAGQPGVFAEDVIIGTTSGDITLHCVGTSKSSKDIILYQDFENGMAQWIAYTEVPDSPGWEVVDNVNAGSLHCASDVSYVNGIDNPTDDYILTPSIDIPEDGAVLTFEAAAASASFYEEAFQLLASLDDGKSFEAPLLSVTLDKPDWTEYTVNLNDYAGKKIKLVWRHYNSNFMGEALLLDNVIVAGKSTENVDYLYHKVVDTVEYWSLDGMKLSSPVASGVYIVKTLYTDGTTEVRKVVLQ